MSPSPAVEAKASAPTLNTTIAKLEESERSFRLLVESVTDYAIFMLDTEGRVSSWNAGAERIKGYGREEIIGQHFSRFYTPEAREAGIPAKALETARQNGRFEAEDWRLRKDGSRFWANVVIDAIHDEQGQLVGFAKVTRDLTERRAMENRIQHVQKMEAIGQLTSGIAHDFNNLLTVILGNLELVGHMFGAPGDDPTKKRIERSIAIAMDAGRRGARLTRRLLTFSRQQALQPEPVDVNGLIQTVKELLGRTLGAAIDIRTEFAPDLGLAFVDLAELESTLLNLAVNARDAMPDGGTLTLRTASVSGDLPFEPRPEFTDSSYILIEVSDSGIGMGPDILARVFEPFFTTKEIGRGTGLGLSQVFGFVNQSGGHVAIESEPGKGTTVRLYLPKAAQDFIVAAPPPEAPEQVDCPERAGTILLVEDDDAVRRFSADVLWSLGYRVLEAPHAKAALEILDTRDDIRLLFTDIGLPGVMDGWQLSKEVRQRRPHLKVLFTTAYIGRFGFSAYRNEPGTAIIVKPFSYRDLARKVSQIMLAAPGGS